MLYKKLPPELRIDIWKKFIRANPRRLVRIFSSSRLRVEFWPFFLDTQFPCLLNVQHFAELSDFFGVGNTDAGCPRS
jgi:hypothetical protein